MPRGKRRSSLDVAIAKATQEFAATIQELVAAEANQRAGEAEATLAQIQAALGKEPSPTKKPGRKPKAATVKRRKKRVAGAEVQKAALDALRAMGGPAGMAALVSATGYSQTQLRNALAGLVDDGEARRKGERRSTTYEVAGRKGKVSKKTTAKKTAPKKKAAAAKKKTVLKKKSKVAKKAPKKRAATKVSGK